MKNNQFIKVACISPKLIVGSPKDNVQYMLEEVKRLSDIKPEFIVFPEMAVTGYTIGDLIFQSELIKQSNEAIEAFLAANTSDSIIIFGAPIEYRDHLYNAALVVLRNRVLGIVPKQYLPNYNEFYDKRYFASGFNFGDDVVMVEPFNTPMGTMLFKEASKDVMFGIEICEDLHTPIAPSSFLSINGAELIFNLSSSNQLAGKDEVRRFLVQGTAKRNHIAYVYAASSCYESTQDTVFASHHLICEDGTILAESPLFNLNSEVTFGEIDLGYLKYRRKKSSTLKDSYQLYRKNYHVVNFDANFISQALLPTTIDATPFIPKVNPVTYFKQILSIQAYALAKRVEHVGAKTLLIGLSGGLDSTLALLVAYETIKILGRKPQDIIAITMPGFGTSNRTRNNAEKLAHALQVTFKTISIKDSVLAHFAAIEHNPDIKDVTYENAQARERTNILMNLANKYQGIVVGTGDLSELALGWATFNGDHMSHYNVNVGLPKTLVRFMVEMFAKSDFYQNEAIKHTLLDIVDTPISPELTGQDQLTEAAIGKYEVNDFIIYRMLVKGDSRERIEYLLGEAFKNHLTRDEIKQYLDTFYKRFYSQQFKRSTLPDGPKVVEVSLSPRSDWRMPTDAKYRE